MPHGYPDYGIAAPSEYVFPIVSYQDYFMRQGLIKTLDGKGDIIFFDSFEGNMAKWFQSAGTATVELSPDHARGGNWALKLEAGTTARATIPVKAPNRFGLELNFTYPQNYYRPAIHLYYYTGTRYYCFGVRYSSTLKKLQYYAPGDTWISFADVALEVLPLYYFHPAKLVIDASKLEYVKFLFRETEYDLSGLTTTYDVYPCRRAVQPVFNWNYLSGVSVPSYIDDVIVTTNEP